MHHIEVRRNLGIFLLNSTREPTLIGFQRFSDILQFHANTAQVSWPTIVEVWRGGETLLALYQLALHW